MIETRESNMLLVSKSNCSWSDGGLWSYSHYLKHFLHTQFYTFTATTRKQTLDKHHSLTRTRPKTTHTTDYGLPIQSTVQSLQPCFPKQILQNILFFVLSFSWEMKEGPSPVPFVCFVGFLWLEKDPTKTNWLRGPSAPPQILRLFMLVSDCHTKFE